MAAKRKDVMLGGIRFKWSDEIRWQDAYKCLNVSFEDVLKAGRKYKVTAGFWAKVGENLLICNEMDDDSANGDFTVVPLKADIKVK